MQGMRMSESHALCVIKEKVVILFAISDIMDICKAICRFITLPPWYNFTGAQV